MIFCQQKFLGKYLVYTHNYKILNFLSDPLTPEGLEILLKKKRDKKGKRPYMYSTGDFKDYISLDLREIFNSLKIFPDILIIFGHENDEKFQPKAVVHSDIRFSSDEWIDSPCAINWEITDSSADFSWWDVKGAKKFYPPPWNDQQYLPPKDSDLYFERLLGSGAHYTEWLNFNSEDYSVIETGVLTKGNPILIRTDIPHSVKYSNYKNRISISLRFPIEEISSWDGALEIFDDYIK